MVKRTHGFYTCLSPRSEHLKAYCLHVNKQVVLDQIIATLTTELSALTRAANDAFAAATDPDSKAENKYDTRSLEASYVARGQAQRVAELQEAVHVFKAMSGEPQPADSPIGMGALVSLDTPEGPAHYLIAAQAGGTEVQVDGHDLYVITIASPLGQRLQGLHVGDRLLLRPGIQATVASVC